jgi:hypothetical protein
MNPHKQFCHNKDCRAYTRQGEGHIVIHSQKERHYLCKRCLRTFSQSTGTALYRLHKPKELVFLVITLLAHGCPLQAIVAAFGLDERTVAREGSERPGCTAGGYTSTWLRPGACSWGKFRPTSYACGWSVGLCGWPGLWRSKAGCGWEG